MLGLIREGDLNRAEQAHRTEIVLSPETEARERALDALLRACIAADHAEEPRSPEIVAVTAESLAVAARMTRLDLDVADLARRPVRAACRQAIRRIGEHLFVTLGGTARMSDLAERVAGMDPARYGYRAVIIDHAWDGIGTDTDRWCC